MRDRNHLQTVISTHVYALFVFRHAFTTLPLRPEPGFSATLLGSDTVVGRALCALLEGSGYRTRLLDSHSTGVVDELLEGAHLLLLAPRVDEGVREAFVGAMGKSTPQKGRMPVIALHTDLEEDLPEKEGESLASCGRAGRRTSWTT